MAARRYGRAAHDVGSVYGCVMMMRKVDFGSVDVVCGMQKELGGRGMLAYMREG